MWAGVITMATRGSPIMHVRIDRATAQRLRAHAAATGQSVTELLRAAVELYLEHEDIPAYTPAPADGQMGIEDMPTE